MFWHWIFSLTSGLLAGWSLAQPGGLGGRERENRGHLVRGLLALAAILGFTYNGWVMGISTGLLTFAVGILGAVAGYVLGRLRHAQLAAESEESTSDSSERLADGQPGDQDD